jgi:lysophospholipase L1-like esterase
MNVLFAGDSITRGLSGYGYLRLLREDFPNVAMTNLGVGGDTLVGILRRLFAELERRGDDAYDVVVLEAGHNDVIIPQLRTMSPLHQTLHRLLPLRGSVPTPEPDAFARTLADGVRRLRARFAGPVIITTLSCLGERLDAPPNVHRAALNDGIRDVAADHDLRLADVGRAFDEALRGADPSDFFLGRFFEMLLLDPLYSRTRRGVTALSRRRGTLLTIDGVHLNYAGATLYRDALREHLQALRSGCA